MLVALSEDISQEFTKATGLDVVPLPKYNKLDKPVSSHADMLLFVIDNMVFCYEEYYLNNINIFKKIENSHTVIKVKKKCLSSYPDDVALNALIIGKTIFAKESSVAKEIKEYAKNNNYKLVNVHQGYSACSTLVINSKSAITSDIGIYNALIKEGYEALLVSTENIELKGYNCGFIGGIGGVLNNKLYIFGELSFHSDCDKIITFLNDKKCSTVEILRGGVYDFGGIKFI